MKETLHANIGSEAFTLDKDAYKVLSDYFDDIRNRLPQSDVETLADIEMRIADIFREKLGHTTLRVVTIRTVREAMQQMGTPADFGECHVISEQLPPVPRKLYRSRSDRSIAGICGGIAHFVNIDVTLLRVITIILIFFGGLSIWIYLILWIVIPDEPTLLSTTKHTQL